MIVIQVASPIELPSHLLQDDKIYLDLPGDMDFEEVIAPLAVNSDGDILVDGVLSIELNYSEVNNLVLRPYIDAHISGQQFDPIDILCYVHGTLTQYTQLKVESKDDKLQLFSCALISSDSHPLTLADKLKLYKVGEVSWPFGNPPATDNGLGVFILNKANLESQFANNEYLDGNDGFLWGFNWYGKTYHNNKFTAIDLRPLYSVLWMARRGFQQLGWTLQSDILESSIFRKAWMYLSDDTYGGNYDENLDKYKFLVENTSQQAASTQYASIYGRKRILMTEKFDNNNMWEADQYVLFAPAYLTQDLHFEFEFDVRNVIRTKTIKISIVYIDLEEIQAAPVFSTTQAHVLVDTTIDLSQDEEKVYRGDVVGVFDVNANPLGLMSYIWVVIDMPDETIINSIKFYNTPRRLRYYEGQYIKMDQPISREPSFGDMMRGIQHLISGVYDIDWVNQIIRLETPYGAKFDGVEVDGLFDELTPQDLTEIVIGKTHKSVAPILDISRTYKYGFKNSTDAYIRSLKKFEGEDQPFDRTIDLGEKYTEGVTTNRNPFFEPTLLNEQHLISGTFPVHLAQLVDNIPTQGSNYAQFSYDIGFRILMAMPAGQQMYKRDDGTDVGDVVIKWYDENLIEYPFFYNSIVGENFRMITAPTTPSLVYGVEPYDLWEAISAKDLLSKILNHNISFETYMNISQFVTADRHRQVIVSYGPEYFVGIIKELRHNYTTGFGVLDMTIPVEFDVIKFGEIVDPTPKDPCLSNKPKILYGRSGSVDTFTLGGVNASVVTLVEFYQDDADSFGIFSGNFVLLTNTTATSVEVTFPNVRYMIKMEVTYDDCPGKSVVHIVNNCESFVNPVLESIFSAPNKLDGIRIDLNKSTFFYGTTSIVSTVRVDGDSPISYTISPTTLYGTYVYPNPNIAPNFILQTLVITFDNGCTYTLPEPINNFDLPIIRAEQGDVLAGNLTFKKVGNRFIPLITDIILQNEPIASVILYRNEKTLAIGETWNMVGVGAVGDNAEFKAIFFFDDGSKASTPWTVAV